MGTLYRVNYKDMLYVGIGALVGNVTLKAGACFLG